MFLSILVASISCLHAFLHIIPLRRVSFSCNKAQAPRVVTWGHITAQLTVCHRQVRAKIWCPRLTTLTALARLQRQAGDLRREICLESKIQRPDLNHSLFAKRTGNESSQHRDDDLIKPKCSFASREKAYAEKKGQFLSFNSLRCSIWSKVIIPSLLTSLISYSSDKQSANYFWSTCQIRIKSFHLIEA